MPIYLRYALERHIHPELQSELRNFVCGHGVWSELGCRRKVR